MNKLIILSIIFLYIQNISCYMYFDVRKYLDNITIQEIIPPFINLENYEPLTAYPILKDYKNPNSEIIIQNFNNEPVDCKHNNEGIAIPHIIVETQRLTINIYKNSCLYRYKNVNKECLYNDANTTGIVLDAFMYTIKNNDNPTLLDCNNLLMNPKIIYGYINILNKPFNMNHNDYMHNYKKYIYNDRIYDSNINNLIESRMSFNMVKDFIRRYFEYNQKIASIGTNYRSLIDNKEHIRKELNLFNNCCNKLNKEHNYLYFYIIKINNGKKRKEK